MDGYGIKFKLRRTSNDDRKRKSARPESYLEFIESRERGEMIIATLCPNFVDPNAFTQQILDSLKHKGFRLFFWVIGHQFKTGRVMPQEDITRIRKYGRVEVENEIIEADERARRFEKFINKIVLKTL